jgi:pimeloyl-ACP methyl ester carboxylesterase
MRASLVIIDQCGHVPYVEQPQQLFESIESFLSD